MERDLDRQRRVYEQALGTNRYMGLPATPRLVVAYSWQPNKITVYPVPAWLVSSLNTTPAGLDGQALADYYAAQRAVFMRLVKDTTPLDVRQYRALIRAVSVGHEPIPHSVLKLRRNILLPFDSGRARVGSTLWE